MAHFNFGTTGGFDHTKMAQLRAVVARRSSSLLNSAEVEDIVSTIISAAVVRASKPDATQDVATIAFAYARHTNYYQRAKEQAVDLRMAMAAARNDEDSDADDEGADDFPDKAEEDDLAERATVRSVERSLPKNLARVLWLCDAEGHTLSEASETLGVPVPTLHRHLRAARVAFKAAWAA